MLNDWEKLFAQASKSAAWTGIFPARRNGLIYSQEERTAGDSWIFRNLLVDLQKDVAEKLSLASAKPKKLFVFADVVRVPSNLGMRLSNTALIVVARRIEVAGQAKISLDYKSSFGAMIMLAAAEIDGVLEADSQSANPALIRLSAPSVGTHWIKYDRGVNNARIIERPRLEGLSFATASPLWHAAVSAFQMAATLISLPEEQGLTSEEVRELRGKAAQMLAFISRCANDAVLLKNDSVPDWADLARESKELKSTLDGSTSATPDPERARAYARLLNKEIPVPERQRKMAELALANSQRNRAPPYELLEAKVAVPTPVDIKYVRHGAQTVGTQILNGWNRPVRKVTLSGVELELDELDRSGFLKAYRGQKDIQELEIHADSLVIKTRLHFPQTQVSIYCRELYFDGADACIDTQPEATTFRASLEKDGADGANAGAIRLFIQRFGTTEKAPTQHFRAIGGKGQDPDEGELALSHTLRHLPLLGKANWDALFSYANIKTMARAPDWDQYKQYHSAASEGPSSGIVYAELEIDDRVIDKVGLKESPGTGGKGPLPGTPGTGGHGGDLYSTLLEAVAPYAALGGGPSGARITSPEGGAGGTPDVAYWFLFKNKVLDGKMVFEPSIEKKEAQKGPVGESGPSPRAATGDEGQLKVLEPALTSPWVTAINLKTALQFTKDVLASGHAGAAREFLVPYRDGLSRRPEAEKDYAMMRLEEEAADLAEQAIQNVDYFGNPPGWVPMLSLESAVKVYQSILDSSIQEIYTSYYVQKAWQAKANRQEALQSLVGLITKSTESTQKSVVATRSAVIASMQSLKQLNLEIEEKLVKPLKDIEERLKGEASFLTDRADKMAIIGAAFKIFGAVAKAIPLPEPYHMAAGALGGVFDVAGELVAEGGPTDKVFGKLKTEVNGFLSKNTDNFIEQSEKGLDESLSYVRKDIEKLQGHSKTASGEKEGLQKLYDEKKAKHDELLKTEQAKLDTMRETLLYGRGSRKKETQQWMEKEFEDFEAAQKKKLLDSTGEYQQKVAEVKKIEGQIAEKEKDFKTSKGKIDEAKKENAKLIKKGVDAVKDIAAGVETVGTTINQLMVSRSQLNSKWEKTLVDLTLNDKEFQQVSAQLTALNKRKTEIATELLALKTSLNRQRNQISNNLLTVNALSTQLGSSEDALDPMAVAYVQSIGHEAHRSLMRFLYYVVKAYEYYTVEASGKQDIEAQKLFEKLQNILEPSDQISGVDGLNADQTETLKALLNKPVSTRGNMLTKEEFSLLKVVYEKPLRDMGKRLADRLASGAGRLLKEFPKMVTLGREELDELNSKIRKSEEKNALPLSLVGLRQIDLGNERQRVGNIKVVKVRCKKLGDRYPDSITFRISLRGKSVVRAQGKLFAFEPEAGKAEAGSDAASGQTSAVVFKTIASTAGRPIVEGESGQVGILIGELLQQPRADRQEDLLTQFLNRDGGGERLTLSEFRPGVFSDFEMTVAFNKPEHKVEFEEIGLEIITEAGDAPDGQTTVAVSTSPPLAVSIMMNTKDMSGRTGGLGSYIGIFKDQLVLRVEVAAEYGNYRHTGWCVDGENRADAGRHQIEVKKSCYVVALFERP